MQKYSLGLYEKAMPNNLTIREKLDYAKKANYDYIELSIDASEDKINRIYMSKAERLSIIHDMYETEITIDSFCVSALTKYALGDPDDRISSRGIEIITGAIALAKDLGARIVMIPGYDIYFGTSTAQTRDKYIHNLRVITDQAAKYGVCLGFETMENEFMNTTQKAAEYVKIIDSPYLQIYPDSGNITNAIKTYGTDFVDDITTGHGHILALHLKETVPGKFREIPYGTGHVDFAKVISAAWKLGTRKYVTEFWDLGKEDWFADIVAANEMMRNLLDRN
ncbi:L-ribulose-5-phosphate 3-epimerase [Candidatus Epulonipiscium viviparus]|uniref:L-ribulose-5-phosphate 3-epimerase n=1 Tax=Candidatus Epulonipiscium viviparus TaxID=420336 RepID=UPI00016C0D8E|nr:L-ribulose-5-phosphate 3-epimerase [Candidatus Epulopiscium viviparus]